MDQSNFRTGLDALAPADGMQSARDALNARAAELKKCLSWEEVRAEFETQPGLANFAGFFLAPHPKQVRDAIERYRRALDADPIGYWHEHRIERELAVALAAADYLEVSAENIATTDSTTMGLAMVYNGLQIAEDQQMLTSEHDHYATRCALHFAAVTNKSQIRYAPLYAQSASASDDEIVDSIVSSITPKTRAVCLTWVHSKTGLRIPARRIADEISAINANRSAGDRILFCLDAVHGIGAVAGTPAQLGCDFFIAGTHKWMFGPRGTGIVWGRSDAWAQIHPIIPPFGSHDPAGSLFTPGGFHTFEHRWALDEAFLFHRMIGQNRIYERIAKLNRILKEEIARIRHVKLHTPVSDELSAGFACFEIANMTSQEVVARLRENSIVASASPYVPSYVRLCAGILNSEEQIDHAISVIHALGR